MNASDKSDSEEKFVLNNGITSETVEEKTRGNLERLIEQIFNITKFRHQLINDTTASSSSVRVLVRTSHVRELYPTGRVDFANNLMNCISYQRLHICNV